MPLNSTSFDSVCAALVLDSSWTIKSEKMRGYPNTNQGWSDTDKYSYSSIQYQTSNCAVGDTIFVFAMKGWSGDGTMT